jgi:diaminopimelate decarboxylase
MEIPSFDDYGEAIAREFAQFAENRPAPELILEPGLALVADAFHFVCRVLEIKSNKAMKYALVAGSVYNVRPTKSRRNLPLRRIPAVSEQHQQKDLSADIVGYTCMEDDVLHENFTGPLEVGDLLVFSNVGAYSLVLKPPFIQCNVPVLGFRSGLNEQLMLKRAEMLDDIMVTYSFE